jgi:hypothetical protein
MLALGALVGMVAAAIEVALVRTYQKNNVILAAIEMHWIGVGALMPYIEIGMPVWVKGITVGVILTIPFVVLDIQKSRNAVIHTSVFAPIWGVAIAYGWNLLSVLFA